MIPPWCFDEKDLSASFDDSMNGIGADFMSSLFNMRDALSALPLSDEPSFSADDTKPECCSTTSDSCHVQCFCCILKAPTSSAIRYNEASLTYLNQGQLYELVMRWNVDKTVRVKSVIKVRFHEYRMELQEQEHLDSWREAHPGERLLDVDVSRSNAFDELHVDPNSPNAVVCVWSGLQCGVAVRLNCIGTEFTAKKHGGEKGVPFRLQVDYFDFDTDCHLESCATQVKVFKMKGADRKHRTDREKLERKSEEGRAMYRPSLPITTLNYLPARHLCTSSSAYSPTRTKRPGGSEAETNGLDQVRKPKHSIDTARVGNYLTPSTAVTTVGTADSAVKANTTKAGLSVNTAIPVDALPASVQTVLQDHTTPAQPAEVVVTSPILATAHFATPAQPLQRPSLVRTRRSSPGPGLASSPSQRHSGLNASVTLHNPRRRRQRTLDTCMGSCSACGRSCRNHCGAGGGFGNRWIRVINTKTRPCCAHWDDSMGVGPRKHPSWLSEKRRASQSYERSCVSSRTQPANRIDELPGTHEVGPQTCDLSTSADSSFGNEEVGRWAVGDSHDGDLSVHSAQANFLIDDPNPISLESGLSSRDGGYSSSDMVAGVSLVESEPPYCPSAMPDLQSPLEVAVESHKMDVQTSKPVLDFSSAELSLGHGSTCHPPIHTGMTSTEVSDWLRAANFSNLMEIFKTYTGRDMLRLTKEDFLALCGPVEGIRLHNAFFNKPARPRCTIYVRRNEKAIYQAIMLYELTRDELLRLVAPILNLRPDQVHIFCVFTVHDVPVLLTDQLVSQFEDQSCYQLEVRSHTEHTLSVSLRPRNNIH
ncbi:transcription factor CP2 [Paragonimus westermani]|uniref:Transcription factor CP2 n=1 Tax=Paragonimus westermani TaxID=34504 RepID=A0A5J4P4L2_9TREM|nr:transcription factor CP2 [Paragonimus westermani]